ncbi:MAG: ATP-binding protein [bacterium]|nr:ATP-binding protein [bacterium]
MGSLVNFYSASIWLVGIIVLLFASTIVVGSNRTSARLYGSVSFIVAAWCVALGAFYAGFDLAWIETTNRFAHVLGSMIAAAFFYFCLSFPVDRSPSWKITAPLVLWQLILAYLLLATTLVIDSAFVGTEILERGFSMGPLGWVFYINFLGFFSAGFIVLTYQLLKEADHTIRGQIQLVYATTALGASIGTVTGVILPMLGYFDYYWLAPFSILPWLLSTAYTIVRHGIFAVKMVLGEFFIFAIVGFLFISALLGSGDTAPASALPLFTTSFIPIIHWVSAIIIGSYAIILFLTSRVASIRIFSLIFFTASLWFFWAGIYFASTNPHGAHIAKSIAMYFGGPAMISLFLVYALHLHNVIRFTKLHWVGFLLAQSVLSYIYIGTDTIVSTVVFTGPRVIDRTHILGTLGGFHIIFIATMLTIATIILRRYKKNTKNKMQRAHNRWISIATILTAPPLIVAVIIAPLFGYSDFVWTAPLFGLVWVGISSYAIVRYTILNRTLFFSQILIVGMLAVMFANIFVIEATAGALARIGVLGAFLATGALFVRITLREEQSREELGKLTDRMETMNANLESLVHKRTQEINNARIHTNTIIEQLTHGLIELTPEGTVVRINEAAEALLGVGRKEVLDTHPLPDVFNTLVYPHAPGHQEGDLPRPLNLPPNADVREITIQTPTKRELQVTTVPMDKADGLQNTLRLLRDITRHKLISQSKTEFISIAAHQLRTPLAGIRWAIELLVTGGLGKISATGKDQLLRADASNNLLLLLINDLLLVSRIETGKEVYAMKELAIQPLVRSTLEPLTDFAKQEHVALTSKMPRTTIRLYADEKLLGRALFSLIDNAIRYNSEGGSVEVALEQKSGNALLTVTDTGTGIPPQEKEQLFSKFYRSEASIKRHTEGAGLALFITKHIIEQHNGELTINAAPEKGTIASIVLPTL